MSRHITVTLPVDEALFVLAALDSRSAEAHSAARKMRNLGHPEDHFELSVAHAAATKSDAARKRIADALWPLTPETEAEVEFGLV